ncbi:tRNA splicing endonuclease-like protein subunit [Lophium mytilinum]|uniref:tRNA splicing endonuclease-like protein subunit n=1 Tax=Lophium mytilinum TaxID=390894 RepID=A0A6A6QUY7_9PEZI|nr:tRNA splicing endonuclease-like protein subunit [Lophium mytilinum]
MADEDEDMPQLSGGGAGDIDLSDETQDFRFLSTLSITGTDLPKIPKRGEKDFEPHATARQTDTLAASRAAMHTALSIPRIHAPKNHMVAIYEPSSNMASVEKAKSQHFQTIGRFANGKEWLLPEETLFMLERGSLDVRWPVKEGEEGLGVPMSLQGAYAAFIGMEGGVGGRLTLEMYNVYAGLKRAGYIVLRTGTWHDAKVELNLSKVGHAKEKAQERYWGLGLFGELWKRLFRLQRSDSLERFKLGPLVTPGLYRNWTDIYKLLEVIPRHDRTAPPKFMLPDDISNPFRITFDVYKPVSQFRKSKPGPPDYRIAVINARETAVPTMVELNDLLATTPYDLPNPSTQMYQKLKYGSRNIILAVVDNGIPSYIRIADAPFEDEKLYERIGRGRGGKRGGFRGRGRGRGRGR